MKSLLFEVEFLSDIVLPATSNTEGSIEKLEFIPGSNFLGMVANKYDDFQDSFNVFHSGSVRFGDARLLVDGQEYIKMPFSLFHPKLNEKAIYHHHFLTENKGQLEQMRKGYIFPDISDGLKVKYIDYNYAQKSAYDTANRRSKTSSMYGYSAISSGTKWQFVVRYDESRISSDDIALIKRTLESSKRLGKSKSSQYGAIKITYIGTRKNSSETPKMTGEVILYAKSRLALVDKEGNATYDLNYLVEGVNVVYDKCQIRTSSFTPYNGAMKTKTYERMVIEKGSVIVLESVTPEQLIALQQGVGVYLADGFGELLINPPFLIKSGEIKLVEKKKDGNQKDQREKIEKKFENNNTVQFLVNRHNKSIKNLALADKVQKFIVDNKLLYKNIKNAQWGTIRSICSNGSKNFLDEIEVYISSGKVSWSKTQIDTLLSEEKYSLEFIKLVAIQMPKEESTND
ncbi:hypothetical protein KKC13_07155 [bacterium]|nr:hypothetical protein [bacterium]MBU1956915.1 hypothetical protein [bacterium]